MYRVYYLSSSDEWVLYSRAETESDAYSHWDECCDKYPQHRVKMTEETVIKEA